MGGTNMVTIGWILTGLYALFTLGASVAPKLMRAGVAERTLSELGWPEGWSFRIGLLELACLALYVWPATNVLGAILTTALLGGAIATQLRAGSPLWSHVLFGVYLGLAMWGGLWLRDPALQAIMPIR